MNWILKLTWWCFFANSLLARQGTVETRDGHVYEGHVRLDSNLVVVANAARDLLAYVDLTNLAGVTFEKEFLKQPDETVGTTKLPPGPWQNEDVGSVGLAGSATCASGLFTV